MTETSKRAIVFAMSGNLRAHQVDVNTALVSVLAGDPRRKMVIHVTPGGGKSILPVIAGIQLIPTIADKLCWVVPRLSLARQAALEFESGTSKNIF